MEERIRLEMRGGKHKEEGEEKLKDELERMRDEKENIQEAPFECREHLENKISSTVG